MEICFLLSCKMSLSLTLLRYFSFNSANWCSSCCVCVCVCTRSCVHVCVCECACVCVSVHVHIHVCVLCLNSRLSTVLPSFSVYLSQLAVWLMSHDAVASLVPQLYTLYHSAQWPTPTHKTTDRPQNNVLLCPVENLGH